MNDKTKKVILKKLGIAASANSGRIHIIEIDEGWLFKAENRALLKETFKTKRAALRKAKSSPFFKGRIVVHERNGSMHELENA